jgi:hypothetical protein
MLVKRENTFSVIQGNLFKRGASFLLLKCKEQKKSNKSLQKYMKDVMDLILEGCR